MAAEAQHASSRERPNMSAGSHGRRILEAREEAKLTASGGDIRQYLINGSHPFADGVEPAAIAEMIVGEIHGIVTLLGLGFDYATKAMEESNFQASEMMATVPRCHARAMEGIARLAALAGFFASEAQG